MTLRILKNSMICAGIVSLFSFRSAKAEIQFGANDYCVAIRGNGQLMPAHWGALAQSIETFGIPKGVAGGSSGSITSFLLESILMNPQIRGLGEVDRAKAVALLIKSLQGFTNTLASQPEWRALGEFVRSVSQSGIRPTSLDSLLQIVRSARENLSDENKVLLNAAADELLKSKVFSGPALMKVRQKLNLEIAHPSRANEQALQTQMKQLEETLQVFGKFDAKADQALFLRDGIVNFKALADLFGKMAAFYALKNASVDLANDVQKFFQGCADLSAGHTWNQFASAHPECHQKFSELVQIYFARDGKNQTRLFEKIGTEFHTIISTSVVSSGSRQQLLRLKSQYDRTGDDSVGNQMQVERPDIHFGYWGQKTDLARINKIYKTSPGPLLHKEKIFMSLGEAPWVTALATSPAEPGLSAFQQFQTQNGVPYLSLGGWSDLIPTSVLKAVGCPRVVYLTRVGGESVFSQGVAKRLFQLSEKSISWDALDSASAKGKVANEWGNPSDQTSLWSMMFNAANPQSSYMGSLNRADAIVCTNWNQFQLPTDFSRMIEDAYQAPIYLANPALLVGQKNFPNSKILTREQANEPGLDGGLRYAGCIPRF